MRCCWLDQANPNWSQIGNREIGGLTPLYLHQNGRNLVIVENNSSLFQDEQSVWLFLGW
ncbi:MAG: hypothetical protein H6669_07350 [Ardenticatenaceae bacterium]|nr:hypothetical protein [Ardenticatenaceae bacterium]